MESQENNIIVDSGEKISSHQEISELKLQLNASQQIIASLELKIRQKEEIIIKAQADAHKETDALKSENKKLKVQLKETSKKIESSSTGELQDAIKAAEDKANKALNELHEKMQQIQKMNQIMSEYERSIANHTAEYNTLNETYKTVGGNLATLEIAFHDVIQKYERTKTIIEGYKANEEIWKDQVEALEKNIALEVQRYESLKAHAGKQIDKANKDNNLLKNQFDSLEVKQNAIIKRLEIKIASLENSLEQKIRECEELSALCDEVTGKTV